jgi:hypothetical protein
VVVVVTVMVGGRVVAVVGGRLVTVGWVMVTVGAGITVTVMGGAVAEERLTVCQACGLPVGGRTRSSRAEVFSAREASPRLVPPVRVIPTRSGAEPGPMSGMGSWFSSMMRTDQFSRSANAPTVKRLRGTNL